MFQNIVGLLTERLLGTLDQIGGAHMVIPDGMYNVR